MYKQVVKAIGTEVVIQVPQQMAGKELEITVEESTAKVYDTDREKLLKEARAFFRSIAVDMSDFKFNRDEANER